MPLSLRFQLPIIADEIYAGMVFEGTQFHSFASVSNRVPMIVVSGLAKRFLAPGMNYIYRKKKRNNIIFLEKIALVVKVNMIIFWL